MADDDALSDFMDSIGLDVKPTSPEDVLMIQLTAGGGYKKIHNFRYWFYHELYAYYDLVKDGCVLMRKSTVLNEMVPYTKLDFARARTKYYLRMQHHPWFHQDVSGLGILDINKMCDMMLKHECIVPLVEGDEKSLPPRN